MPLTENTAIVTLAEVEGRTGERQLANLGVDTASLLAGATNAIIDEARQPWRNLTEAAIAAAIIDEGLKTAASFYVAARIYAAQPADAEGMQAKADRYERLWSEKIRALSIRTADTPTRSAKTSRPISRHYDYEPYMRGVNNERRPSRPFYGT